MEVVGNYLLSREWKIAISGRGMECWLEFQMCNVCLLIEQTHYMVAIIRWEIGYYAMLTLPKHNPARVMVGGTDKTNINTNKSLSLIIRLLINSIPVDGFMLNSMEDEHNHSADRCSLKYSA